MTQHSRKIEWLARQMYSHTRPIGREQIFAAFTTVLTLLTQENVAAPALIASREDEGAEFLGYSAPHLTYRVAAGAAALICTIDPILASMGVSGEWHAWSSEGLPAGVVIRGAALSSGRNDSWAELVLEGLSNEQALPLLDRFMRSFPPVMTQAELEAELERR